MVGVSPLMVHGKWVEGLSTDHACGVQFVEASVDTETGLITVDKIVGLHDCGLIINQPSLESQINGGIIMGMGYALYEERVMDGLSGVVLNPNFETYKLPGMADMPDIEIVLINMPERGVIGIGEPATVATAPWPGTLSNCSRQAFCVEKVSCHRASGDGKAATVPSRLGSMQI